MYKPSDDSDEIKYLQERRKALGGYLPNRNAKKAPPLKTPEPDVFKEFFEGSGEREVSTTMAFVQLFNRLLRNQGNRKTHRPDCAG